MTRLDEQAFPDTAAAGLFKPRRANREVRRGVLMIIVMYINECDVWSEAKGR